MNMNTIKRNIGPALLSIAIVAAAFYLPKAAAGEDQQGEIRCNIRETKCLLINWHDIDKHHIAVITRRYCQSARPSVLKINGTWHSRFTCNGVLKEMRFQEVKYRK